MLQPLNDLAQIRLDKDEFGFGASDRDTAESGILVALPEQFPYFGMWSFAFEVSLGNTSVLEQLHEHYQQLIGKRVYWTALSEKGNVIKAGDERYAFIKLTSLITYDDDPNSKAENIHGSGAGSFKV